MMLTIGFSYEDTVYMMWTKKFVLVVQMIVLLQASVCQSTATSGFAQTVIALLHSQHNQCSFKDKQKN